MPARITGIRMSGMGIAGIALLVLAGLAGADYLATTIATDGMMVLHTEGSDENGSYSSGVMATDAARLSRTLAGDRDIAADLSVASSGQVLFTEYADGFLKESGIADLCSFFTRPGEFEEPVSAYASGILGHGEYDSSRKIGPDLSGAIFANGSGMITFGASRRDNRSVDSDGFVSGNFTVSDTTRIGGKR